MYAWQHGSILPFGQFTMTSTSFWGLDPLIRLDLFNWSSPLPYFLYVWIPECQLCSIIALDGLGRINFTNHDVYSTKGGNVVSLRLLPCIRSNKSCYHFQELLTSWDGILISKLCVAKRLIWLKQVHSWSSFISYPNTLTTTPTLMPLRLAWKRWCVTNPFGLDCSTCDWSFYWIIVAHVLTGFSRRHTPQLGLLGSNGRSSNCWYVT